MKVLRVLCPVDFSDASRHAIEHALIVAEYYRAKVAALHVVTPLALGLVAPGEEPERLARLRAATAEEFRARAHPIPVETFVDVGDPVVTILQRASTLPADLIVMGTHGASGFQHLILGSVTEKVLRKASCPVLTVPPRAQATSRLPFKRIVCAVDFSDPSLQAMRAALSVANEAGAGLTLLSVLEWPWPEPPSPTMDDLAVQQRVALTEFRRYEHERATTRLASLLAGEKSNVPVTTRVGDGKPHVEILRVAVQEQADLIVMGVHGRNPVDIALFGSTTNQVVRRATCPVLTIRD